jgi:hypothetical protein
MPQHFIWITALQACNVLEWFWKQQVAALTTSVVDGIALNVLRIRMLGIRHIMVASLVPQTCMPYNTYWVNNSTACITNDMISNETIQHNALLGDRMRLLNYAIPESSIIIVNMTKAFQELFHKGDKYGKKMLFIETSVNT